MTPTAWQWTPPASVYVGDYGQYRVLKLAAWVEHPDSAVAAPAIHLRCGGSDRQLDQPTTGGHVKVAGLIHRGTATEFPSLSLFVRDVAVDGAGNVYVLGDTSTGEVLKFAAASTTPTTLPFTGLDGHGGVAADNAGDVYVADAPHHRVLKLTPGSTTQTEVPFTDVDWPYGVAVDTSGNVYLTDTGNHPRVLKLAPGSTSQTVLPLTGLSNPVRVAVDTTGNVYVADAGNKRVLKLPVQ
jgi:NHL repeat/Beta-propeller repeat